MSSPALHYCARCGRALESGQTRYLVTVSVTADFDGTLDPAGSAGEISRMWREIEGKSEQELMDEIAQKLSFILCKPCRDAWVKEPFGEGGGPGAGSAGQIH